MKNSPPSSSPAWSSAACSPSVTAGISDAAAAANAARVTAEALRLADSLEGILTVAFRAGGFAVQGAIVGAGSDLTVQSTRVEFHPDQGINLHEVESAAAVSALWPRPCSPAEPHSPAGD